MSGCVLHVRGDDFDVDAFLTQSTLRPYQIHRRGEPRRYHGGNHSDSGFSLDVSEADGDLAAQVEDAIRLLREWEPELQHLQTFGGVSDARLDFGYFRRDAAVQCDFLPASLLAVAGRCGIGIELSLYPTPTT